MFSLNFNDYLQKVFLMGQASTNGGYGCSVNFATLPWNSTCCCVIVCSVYKQHTQTYTFSNCFL